MVNPCVSYTDICYKWGQKFSQKEYQRTINPIKLKKNREGYAVLQELQVCWN